MAWLAHGVDPTPLTWDEAIGTLALVGISFGLLAVFSYRAMACFEKSADEEGGREVRVWAALGTSLMGLVVGAFVQSAYRQMTAPTLPEAFHGHYPGYGGQVAMYGNYHIEITRNLAGEFHVFLTDAYRRPIAAEFYEGSLRPEGSRQATPLEKGLGGRYALARLPREVLRVRLLLKLPEKSVDYRFDFSKRPGPKVPPDFCGEQD